MVGSNHTKHRPGFRAHHLRIRFVIINILLLFKALDHFPSFGFFQSHYLVFVSQYIHFVSIIFVSIGIYSFLIFEYTSSAYSCSSSRCLAVTYSVALFPFRACSIGWSSSAPTACILTFCECYFLRVDCSFLYKAAYSSDVFLSRFCFAGASCAGVYSVHDDLWRVFYNGGSFSGSLLASSSLK
jgi:hypothetical protein